MAKNNKRTRDEVKIIVENLGYKFLDEYTNHIHKRKVIIIDSEGYKYDAGLAELTNTNQKISRFDIGNPFTLENISLWLKKNNKEFYLTENNIYKRHSESLELFCKNCKDKFYMTWNKIKAGHNCSNCKESKGERLIRNWIIQNSIHYKSQHRFLDCRDSLPLPFDFYLKKYNLVIEYHGIQHYKRIDFFKEGNGFSGLKKRDKIKIKYCKNKNINILIIPYTKIRKIEEVLRRYFERFSFV